jgi:hypothetical protein
MKKLMIIVCVVLTGCMFNAKEDVTINIEQATSDSLDLVNTKFTLWNSTKDSVKVFITLNGYTDSIDIKEHVQSVDGIFGCTQSGLVGSFYIGANDTMSYVSHKWLAGNMTFNAQPVNCRSVDLPNGINLFEYNLNNNQESIDISAVTGVNCIIDVKLNGGPNWMATPAFPDVRHFMNDTMWHNTNKLGVFPYGCTNCINDQGKQACQTPSEKGDSTHICNPTRAAGVHGGEVFVTFLGYTPVDCLK